MLRSCLIFLAVILLSLQTDAQTYTVEEITEILGNGSWQIEKTCFDDEGCTNGNPNEYHFAQKQKCANDSCFYIELTTYELRYCDSREIGIMRRVHNTSFVVHGLKPGAQNVFLITYHVVNSSSYQAELKIFSKNRFMVYGPMSYKGLNEYIYYKRVRLPEEISKSIENKD